MDSHGASQVCGHWAHITKSGLVPKHRDCLGGQHAPLPHTGHLEALLQEARNRGDDELTARYARRLVHARKVSMTSAEAMEIEREEAALELMFRSLAVVFWQAKAYEQYSKCRCCGKELNAEQYKVALRRYETQLCGDPECSRKDYIKRYGCCEKATPIHCVCMASFTCPDHGEKHVGTHD
jgi:hypothetical protein